MESFIARQPIFDRQRAVIAYELLFRDGISDVFEFPDPTEATSRVMLNGLTLFGIQVLTGGRKAFVNLTRDVLIEDYVHLFSTEDIACEILEDIPADMEAVSACRRLKKHGFTIVMDDYSWRDRREELVELADIVKIDFSTHDDEELKGTTKWLRNKKVTLLAEKVETYDDFNRALKMGFDLFQGYFFAKPELMQQRDLAGSKMNCMRLITEVQNYEIDFNAVEKIVKQDVSLSYRLLRYINSAYFGFRVEIRSIKQAVVLLGSREFSRWATLVAMSGLVDDKPAELFSVALTRARFLELLAPQMGQAKNAEDLFMVGLFSLLDASMDAPFEKIIENIPVTDDVKDALLQQGGLFIRPLKAIIQFERGNWAGFFKEMPAFAKSDFSVPGAYIAAVGWVQKSLSELK
ncbi:MAG: HDOD domain-containing protein [Proteobacteria bacterium]|nr:HDOD domain-containing protein [Pseudomonadota bacterium]